MAARRTSDHSVGSRVPSPPAIEQPPDDRSAGASPCAESWARDAVGDASETTSSMPSAGPPWLGANGREGHDVPASTNGPLTLNSSTRSGKFPVLVTRNSTGVELEPTRVSSNAVDWDTESVGA